MALELATAYVSIVPETGQLKNRMRTELGAVQKIAETTGKSMGHTMGREVSTGINAAASRAFKTGAFVYAGMQAAETLGAGVKRVLDEALKGGFNRLNITNQAEAQLHALGQNAKQVRDVIQSAKDIVDGTALSLPEMVRAASMAVAAGVPNGEKLNRWLRTLADTASFTHAPLQDITMIMDKVVTQGRAYQVQLNQLALRGLPINKWLEEYSGLQGKAFAKWKKDGNVSADVLVDIIEKKIGGAAKTMGGTVQTRWLNLKNAIARVGEELEKPTFNRLAGWFYTWARAIDTVKPKVTAFAQSLDQSVMWEWGPKIVAAAKDAAAALSDFGNGRVSETFTDIKAAALAAAPGIAAVAKSFAAASAAVGGGVWNLALAGLKAVLPVIDTASNLLNAHTRIVTAALTAWLGFRALRTVQGIFGGVTASVVGMNAAFRGSAVGTSLINAFNGIGLRKASDGMARLSESLVMTSLRIGDAAQKARTLGGVMGRLGSGITSVGQAATAAGAVGLNRLSGAAGKTATGLAAIGRAVSVGIGLVAPLTGVAVGALALYLEHQGEIKQQQTELNALTAEGAKSQIQFAKALQASGGQLDDAAKKASAGIGRAMFDDVLTKGKKPHTPWENISQWRRDLNDSTNGTKLFGVWDDTKDQAEYDRNNRLGDQYRSLSAAAGKLKVDVEDLWGITAEGGPTYDALIKNLEDGSAAGAINANRFRQLRGEYTKTAVAARNSTDGIVGLVDVVAKLSQESSTAEKRASLLNQAITLMQGGKPDKLVSERQQQERINGLKAEPWDAKDGYGYDLLAGDKVDYTLQNGGRLEDSINAIKSDFVNAMAAGRDFNQSLGLSGDAFKALSQQTGIAQNDLEHFARTAYGWDPITIRFLASLEGAETVEAKVGAILAMLKAKDGHAQIDLQIVPEAERGAVEDAIKKALGDGSVVHKEGTTIEITGDPAKLDQLLKNYVPPEPANKLTPKIDTNALDAQLNQWQPRPVQIPAQLNIQPGSKIPGGAGPTGSPLPPQPRAAGGPIFGPGGPTSDSVPALLSVGEHVLTAQDVKNLGGHRGVYSLRSAAKAGGLAFAEGGAVPVGIKNAWTAAEQVEGHPYLWGGGGPNFDCSGFIAYLQLVAMGKRRIGEWGRWWNTFAVQSDPGKYLLERGRGPVGTLFRIGITGKGVGHVAATIGGRHAESGGPAESSGIGTGRAGADDPQFEDHYYLPNAFIQGYTDLNDGLVRDGKYYEWDETDDGLKLAKARNSLAQARERYDEVVAKRAQGAKGVTDIDVEAARLAVRDAEHEVSDLEYRRDHVGELIPGTGERDASGKDAGPMNTWYSDSEMDQIEAEASLSQAIRDRNSAYDKYGNASPEARQADVAVQKAYKAWQKTTPAGKAEQTLTDLGKTFGGIVVDAALEMLPFGLGSKLDTAYTAGAKVYNLARKYSPAGPDSHSTASETTSGGVAEAVDALAVSPGRDQLINLGLLPDSKKKEIPEWARKVLPVGVYDSGGWLEPGQMAINLSNRPEPVFNSPAQLHAFAGGLTAPSSGSGMTREEIEAMIATRPNVTINASNVQEALSRYEVMQKRNAMSASSFSRR
ncbi:tape measure protein [Nocardia terpenica]|uniref:NlpC/P60 domain-containing protein n=1 Tax=Nocardia terpenica TaxID=455432 RepID=A0A6G9Z6L4_9NOCA|nr:tape measure protein [Nocardia terpenica]QIS21255.1 hypothetical protein F6W96_25940 [Nocardia terpenica]